MPDHQSLTPRAAAVNGRLGADAPAIGLRFRKASSARAMMVCWREPGLGWAETARRDQRRYLLALSRQGVAVRAAGLVGEAAVTAAHAAALAPFMQADGSLRIGARYMAVLALA